MADNKRGKNSNSETPDNYGSEGMTYGVILGVFLFFALLVTKHASAGAVLLAICTIGGMLIGMAIPKPDKGNEKVEKEVDDYKKLDKERNAFFPDRSKKSYNPEVRKPMLRTDLANGEKIAGFYNMATNTFEEKMLVRDEKDIRNFMRMYGVADEKDICLYKDNQKKEVK